MGFIYHYVGHVEDGEICVEGTGLEALRAKVEELVVSVGGVVQGKVHFTAVHAGVDGYCPYASGLKVLDLVLHEGYEGSDHKGYSVLHEGGYLEAHALAASCWKYGKDIPAIQSVLDDLLLHGPE